MQNNEKFFSFGFGNNMTNSYIYNLKNNNWEENADMLNMYSLMNTSHLSIMYENIKMKIKYIKLPKNICKYLELNEKDITLDKLSNALELKSNNYKLKFNKTFPPSSLIFCNEGKNLFQLKSNIINKNCLLDLILYNYNNIPNCDFFHYYQEPVNISILI